MDEDYLCDRIDDFEGEYIECLENIYYIGCTAIIRGELLFVNSIKPKTFFQFSYDEITTYFGLTSCIRLRNKPSIDIVVYKIVNDDYIAIIKTFWIKLIQRKWKKIMEKRKAQEMEIRKNILSFIQDSQMNGFSIHREGLMGMI